MSQGLKILEERLAKGEISVEEYENLSAVLTKSAAKAAIIVSDPTEESNSSTSDATATQGSERVKWHNTRLFYIVLASLSLFMTLYLVRMQDNGGLNDAGVFMLGLFALTAVLNIISAFGAKA